MMECILEGGTDAGSMVLFDPDALPMDFDAKYKDDPLTQLEELTRTGHLYWLNTHSDGSYSIGVYLRDRLPGHLEPFAKRIDVCDHFHVPSGRLFFTGMEYVFQSNDSSLHKYPHMGESAELPAGSYPAVFFDFEYPEDFHEDLLQRRLSVGELRAFRLMNTLAPTGCITLFVMLGSFWIMKWTLWAAMILPCGLVLIALPFILSRLPAYRKAQAVYKAIHKEYPAYGVLLQTPSPV